MKKEIIDFEDFEITFLIGQNAKDNFDVIDKADKDDIWFHSKGVSSCHVVALLPKDLTLEKKELNQIIKEGALLCKMSTNKISNLNNVPIIYTEIKNVTKTKEKGTVLTKNTKIIVV